MKKTVSWNGLIAMAAILAMGVLVFGCTDQQTINNTAITGSGTMKGSIAGLVVDINNNPVEGAMVFLQYPGGGGTVRTGTDGGYLFSNVPVSGQLGCQDDCDENPYLITVGSPGTKIDGEWVATYATTYTAALLSFTSLQAIGAYENEGETSNWQAVSGMQVQAITAVMRRPNAIVSGYVRSWVEGTPVDGAVVTLNPSRDASPPDPREIWEDGEPTFAIGDPTTVTGPNGLFTFTGVPEGSDSAMVEYIVTVLAQDLQICNFCGKPEVSVGTGGQGFPYWVDADCGIGGDDNDDNDLNQADAVALCPALPPIDEVNPWVMRTNLPASQIPGSQLGNTWCWQFNEAVDQDLGSVVVNIKGGAPIGLDPALSGWDLTGEDLDLPAACPAPGIGSPVLFATPAEELPSEATIVFELSDIADTAGNQYDGNSPFRTSDAFTSLGTDEGATARGFTTGGDPTVM
jgi:hypothetical protein